MHQPLPPNLQDQLAEIAFREADPIARARRHEELIAAHPEHADALRAAVSAADMPAALGPFRILALLGEGGFGRVYRAQQTSGVDRHVALKVLRNDLDSRAVLARFELERQVLASMNHDAIARFFEAGQVDGQPWFSMELVQGEPITHYCDEQRLSLSERLQLFLQVCDGVQHAHGKGIVHRDLKPANVLVSGGGRGHVAKIIDFGIARATDRQLSQSMQTMLGMVLGTPEYMAPEQCGGDPLQIDARTDVYALGVMLYELVSGQLPFAPAELPRDDLVTVQKVLRQKDPPKPSTKIATVGDAGVELAQRRRLSPTSWRRAVRGDLDDIVGRAMEKEQGRRYASVADLAADLRRHLAHEPIVARPPSGVYRLKKFVARYRGQVAAAAAIGVTLAAGVVVSVWFAWKEQERANENSKLAQEKGVLAQSESAAKEQFAGKVREFDQLAGMVLYERAIANEKELYPPWPHKVAAMEEWLKEDAGKLLAMRDGIEQTVRDLRARALPATAEDREQDRRTHATFAEFETAEKRVASLRYAQAIRAGTSVLVVLELSAAQQALDAQALNTLAWERVAPNPEERKVWGEEPLGLAAARLAAAKAKGSTKEFEIVDTLAWALLANGQDAAAKEASARALDLAPEEQVAKYEESQRAIDAAIANAADDLRTAEARVAELGAVIGERRTFRFELQSQRFLHDTLTTLLEKLASLEKNEKAAVEQRLLWAKQVRDLTLHHPNARHTWREVRAAIAQNPKYAGQTIELRDEDVMGLVPIGENPVTHLWEFYELRSAWDGEHAAAAMEIPQHETDGSTKVTNATGIVFVLVPGTTFWMGSQKDDPDGANFDRGARKDEQVHQVALAPFLLARHELTRAQWLRLGGTARFWYSEGVTQRGDPVAIGPTHPAESMSWDEANACMERNGLDLPTEAQWECGCRAETSTPWWPGADAGDLQGCENVHDRTSAARRPDWGEPTPITDGFWGIAPVATFRANAFGLYDVHGNVREWCRDGFGFYGGERPGDGLQREDKPGSRCLRGGGYGIPARGARSAFRFYWMSTMRNGDAGVRAARRISRAD